MSKTNPSWAAQNYRLNKDRIYDNQKRYRQNNQIKIRKYYNALQSTYRYNLKNSVYKILGGFVCVKCGQMKEKILQIDHIHNTGKQDKARFKTRESFLKYYKTHPIEAMDNLQVLCANCNWEKRL